jgi:hypothetical protein
MNIKVELVDTFEHIRQTFFPRWDRNKDWSVVLVDDLDGAQGRCEPGVKQIQLATYWEGDELTALIIHEIAHAAAGVDHGKRWLARMEKAAADAEKMGMGNLAAAIREQIDSYSDGFRVTAAMIYGELEDAVICQPQMSFDQAMDFVRRDCGLSREQFLKRFRRSRAVYDETRQYVEERARCRATWTREATA